MSELLFEIGCEELPADAIPHAMKGLEASAREKFTAHRIAFDGLKVWSTPRRLTLVVTELADSQTVVQEQLMGPAWRIAFDAEGKPTKAAEGFAAKNNVAVGKLKKIVTDKGEYVGIERKLSAEKTAKLLPQILGELIRTVPFPKSMRWARHEETFGRPIHWIVALLGGKKIPLTFAGIKSGNTTRGHRFLGSPKPIAVTSAKDYEDKLRANFVLVVREVRKKEVINQIYSLAMQHGGTPDMTPALVDEVTDLVEWPIALAGEIEQRFLEIPKEVIVTSMRDHQKYFSVTDNAGKLLPVFITVLNMKVKDPAVVLAGNQRVLAARLTDAVFFVREDLKVPLGDRIEALKKVVFQAKLGTIYEKVERFARLAADLNAIVSKVDAVKLERAARLAKADLTTGMVGEFPELQGVIGSEYARRQGEDAAVAASITEHYLPKGGHDELPKGDIGALISMADKLDTVVGCFGVGLVPTGTADPYALRRSALGVLNILADKKYPLLVDKMVDLALDLVGPKLTRPRPEVRADVLNFFQGRFENLLKTRGLAFDEVDAVLARGFADVSDANARIEALHAFRKDPAFEALASAFKRAANIVQKELGQSAPAPLLIGLLREPAEIQLQKKLEESAGQVRSLFAARKYQEALRAVSALREPVDQFFNDVLVVAKEPDVKANRLALLAELRGLFDSFADFTKLGGAATGAQAPKPVTETL